MNTLRLDQLSEIDNFIGQWIVRNSNYSTDTVS
ncbi:MAG: hypothetical protein UZ09_BCD002000738 [Bacteroidetes bacterium OLB9]|nr:MAG: hypothetical protein UZ09_BCD002000738 [Bacteroidetes bacterium OLB9]